MWEAKLFVEFWKPNFIYARIGASKRGPILSPKNSTPEKYTLICNFWYSFDEVQSLDHFDMLMFEIFQTIY